MFVVKVYIKVITESQILTPSCPFPLSFPLPPTLFIYPGTVCISIEPLQVFAHSSDTVL